MRNLFLLKSVSFIKTKAEKQKQKQGTPGAGADWAPTPFHDLRGHAAVHGAVFTRRSQSAGRAKARDVPRGQHSHFLVPKKLPLRSTLPCVACQMFLQNVSSRLAFVHKVISVGKKSLRT